MKFKIDPNKKNQTLIVLTGPTAVGKTELSLSIAEKYDLEIMSCDSRQFYREMSIGTAKPTENELARVPHHFINSHSITEEFSAGKFEEAALDCFHSLSQNGKDALLTGGSGLYIKALCEGMNTYPEVSPSVLQELEAELSNNGLESLQQELAMHDPAYYKQVDLHNPRRITRALSVIRSSGQPFSFFHNAEIAPRPFMPLYIILERERAELYERINARVDIMIENGLVEEAKGLYPYKKAKALQTVGYQELFDYFEGHVDLTTAIDLIKRNSRRYAKRQLTWFRKIPGAYWFHPDQADDITELIDSSLSK